MAGAEHLWAACVGRLRDEFSDSTWNTWLASARPRALEGYRLVMSVPSALAKERIETRYLDHIHQALAEVTGHPHEVVLEVGTDAAPSDFEGDVTRAAVPPPTSQNGAAVAANGSASAAATPGVASPAARQVEDDCLLNPKFTFDDFVIGDSNFGRGGG